MEKDSIKLLGVTRDIAEEMVFGESGTFVAWGLAQEWLNVNGYSYGSMQRDEPIAIVKNWPNDWWDNFDSTITGTKDRVSLPKWRYITPPDVTRLDGVIIPMGGFREGGAQILIFSPIEQWVPNK